MNTLKKFQIYMGERRILFPLALIASGLSGLMSLVPFVFVWLIVRTLLGVGGTVASTPIGTYAWWAVGTAVAGLLIYMKTLVRITVPIMFRSIVSGAIMSWVTQVLTGVV